MVAVDVVSSLLQMRRANRSQARHELAHHSPLNLRPGNTVNTASTSWILPRRIF